MFKIVDLGIGGAIGLLCGIALVKWVGPTTTGGTDILVLVPLVIGGIIGKLFSIIIAGVYKILRNG